MPYIVEIEETMTNSRADRDDHRPAYKAVAYHYTDRTPQIRSSVSIIGSSFRMEDAERWAQDLRDRYDSPGSQMDHFLVYRVGNRIFLDVVRKDNTRYTSIDAQALDQHDLNKFATRVRDYGLIKVADDPVAAEGKSPAHWYDLCGIYQRKPEED